MLRDAFAFARGFVTEKGFSDEIEWQDSVSLECLAETIFLQVYAWVVIASGMREAVDRLARKARPPPPHINLIASTLALPRRFGMVKLEPHAFPVVLAWP